MGVRGATRLFRCCARVCVLAVTSVLLTAALQASAQIATSGQNISPVFEGWEANADGSFSLIFGYFNRNWRQEIDVPIGPNNAIEPGGPDQGQPTHFYPRRSRFVFRIRVPKDFGKKELVWTLTANGKTERTYGTLHPDYMVDKGVIQSNSGGVGFSTFVNLPPVLKVEGEQTRHVKVGTPITLTAIATDDGSPKPRPMPPPGLVGVGVAVIPQSATGLRFSWHVYRGAGKVAFDPPQFSAWEDDRDGRNSPYSPGWVTPPVPPDGKWVVRATFSEPGTYVLRALAHDGGFGSPVDVTFLVKP